MLESLTQLFIRPKLSPYLSGLMRFACIYGVYLHLAIFIFGSSTMIFTNPISCAVPKDSGLTETYVNSRCTNKPLLKFEEDGLKVIAAKREEEAKKEMKKHGQGRRGIKGGNTPVFVPGNIDETIEMVSYYR